MKIWLKYLIAAIIGTILGYYLPLTDQVQEVVTYVSQLSIQIGRYLIMPLIFLSLSLAMYELRQDKHVTLIFKAIAYIITATVILTFIFMGTFLLLAPGRIPIFIKHLGPVSLPAVKEMLLSLFPNNFFAIFTTSGNFIIPLVVFTILFGLNLNFDRLATRPVLQLINSFLQIFKNINHFFVEIIAFAIIPLIIQSMFAIRGAQEMGLYRQLIILLLLDLVLIVFFLYPFLFFLLNRKLTSKNHLKSPYKALKGLIAPLISGFVSGNNFFTFPVLYHQGEHEQQIPDKVRSLTYVLFILFGKAGTAAISSVSFAIVLKSYSSLGIDLMTTVWIILVSVGVSFLTFSMPGKGVILCLSFLCSLYGRGIEEGYIILQPVLPLLTSFAVLIDTLTAGMATLALSNRYHK